MERLSKTRSIIYLPHIIISDLYRMKVLFLLGYSLLNVTLIVSCRKPCQSDNFEYSGADVFFPEKDSIKVGDTVFVSCIIRKSEIPEGFTHVENLGGNLIISNIDSFRLSSRGAVNDFSYINIQGGLYSDMTASPDNVKQISYLETDSSYNLLVGLIGLKKGSYVLTYTDVPGVRWSGPGKCGTANMFFNNVNENKHSYLFEDKLGPSSPRDSATSYCLMVF